MVNIFVAYMLPEDKKMAFDRIAKNVRDVFTPDGKDELFYHTTLLYIGRVEEHWLPFIKEKLEEIARLQKPINLDINKIGLFYNKKKQCIKVLYAVPTDIPEALHNLCTQLYNTIGQPLTGKTTPPIQPAQIHFTITKLLRHLLSLDDFQNLANDLVSFDIPITIDNFGLYHCKDAEHRYYREIDKYDFTKP